MRHRTMTGSCWTQDCWSSRPERRGARPVADSRSVTPAKLCSRRGLDQRSFDEPRLILGRVHRFDAELLDDPRRLAISITGDDGRSVDSEILIR